MGDININKIDEFGQVVKPEGTANFCSNCGTRLPLGAKFCPECGQRIGFSASASTTTNKVSFNLDNLKTIDHIHLGQTTIKEMENMGIPRATEGIGWFYYNDFEFPDHYFINNYYYYPKEGHRHLWHGVGTFSYNTWLEILRDNGYSIKITKQPKMVIWGGKNTLEAKIEAKSEDGEMKLELTFEYNGIPGQKMVPGWDMLNAENTLHQLYVSYL